MFPHGDGTRSVADVEGVVNLCVKSFDGADQATRTALARLVAHMLASTQVEKVVPVSDTAKKGKKNQKEDEDEDDDSEGGKPDMNGRELQTNGHPEA